MLVDLMVEGRWKGRQDARLGRMRDVSERRLGKKTTAFRSIESDPYLSHILRHLQCVPGECQAKNEDAQWSLPMQDGLWLQAHKSVGVEHRGESGSFKWTHLNLVDIGRPSARCRMFQKKGTSNLSSIAKGKFVHHTSCLTMRGVDNIANYHRR